MGGEKQTKQKQIPSEDLVGLGVLLPFEIKEARSCFRNRSYVDELPRNPGDEEPGMEGGGLKRDFGEVQYMSKHHFQRKERSEQYRARRAILEVEYRRYSHWHGHSHSIADPGAYSNSTAAYRRHSTSTTVLPSPVTLLSRPTKTTNTNNHNRAR